MAETTGCPSCEGSGIVADPHHGHSFTCARCEGTGKVTATPRFKSDNNWCSYNGSHVHRYADFGSWRDHQHPECELCGYVDTTRSTETEREKLARFKTENLPQSLGHLISGLGLDEDD